MTAGSTKADPGSPEWAAEEATEPAHQKGWHKAVKDAAGFLGGLAREKAFGDPHREEAKMCAKALDDLLETKADDLSAEGVDAADPDAPPPGLEAGEMGEKSQEDEEEMKRLQKQMEEDKEASKALNERLKRLMSVLN